METVIFIGEFVFSVGELLVFSGENQQITMVFFSDGYLTVTIVGTKLFYGSTKPSESLTSYLWVNKTIGENN